MAADAKELRPGDKRAWLIVVGLGFLGGGGLQIILAGAGNFIPHICRDLQCDPGQLTLWITFYAIFMALSQPIVGRVWPKVPTRLLVTCAYLVSIIAMALMGTYNEVWQFWISGAVIGIAGGFYFMVARPYLVTNWFAKKTGFAMGCGSIIGAIIGAIMSPVIASIVAAVGWRLAYPIVALIGCVMVLPFSLFVFVFDPAKVGMRPVGWEPGMDDITAGAADASGVPEKKAVITVVFWMLFLVGGIFALYGGYQNLWGFAVEEWGFDAMFTSTMISVTILFGLMAPILGLVIDKIGPWKTAFIVMVIQLLASAGLLLFHSNQVLILILVFFFAFQGTVVGTALPLMVRDAFGAKDYTKLFSYMQMGIGLIGGFSAPVVSFFYTTYGTFDAPLIFAIAIAAISIVFLSIANISKASMKKKLWVEAKSDDSKSVVPEAPKSE